MARVSRAEPAPRVSPMAHVKAVGNATLIVFDPSPVLVTDPWIGDTDSAYFGSWTLPRVIPSAEKAEIFAAKFVWFSHGHPDHLNPQSLAQFKSRQILLPDHVGGRIKRDLEIEGCAVRVLPDRRWVELSPRCKVFCIPNYVQDAALLVDVNGHLFLNLNDCAARGARRLIRNIAGAYSHSYLMKIVAGDPDLNLFDADGRQVEFSSGNLMVGWHLSQEAKLYGAKSVIPFSSFHQYQREDSAWANRHVTPIDAFRIGFDERLARYIEPFVAIDCGNGKVEPIECAPLQTTLKPPSDFGDSWSDQLDAADEALLRQYFLRRERLHRYIGFIDAVVGGRVTRIEFSGPRRKGITFEAPANSLMTAVRYEIFDDLLIGNFMKTTLHNIGSLYDPPINFAITKFGDNGRAMTEQELAKYFKAYYRKCGVEFIRQLMEEKSGLLFRRYVSKQNPLDLFAKRVYYAMR